MRRLSCDELCETFNLKKDLVSPQLSYFENQGMLLIGSLEHPEFKPIGINLKDELRRHEIYFYKNSKKKDPLYRALFGSGAPGHVVDLTSGWLSDSALMLSFGAKVSSYERNPIISLMITSYLKEIEIDRFEFFANESFILNKSADVLYYDPMYGESKSKRTSNSKMRIFRSFIGIDEDCKKYFNDLRMEFSGRIVVKRPVKAEPIDANFHHQVKGKSTRFDIYL